MVRFTLGVSFKLFWKVFVQFRVFSLVCGLPHSLPLYWLMQIGVLLRNRGYQGDGEVSGFCGSQENHTIIRGRFSSFYICGGIKLMDVILQVFRYVFLSVCVLGDIVHRYPSSPDTEAVAAFLSQNKVSEVLQKIVQELVNACLFFLRRSGHLNAVEELLLCSPKWCSD